MSLRTDLQRYLLGLADVKRHARDRVFWQVAPPRTPTPFITYSLISQPPDGVSLAGEHNLRSQIWQFDIWAAAADDPDGSKIEFLAAAVELALLDYSGAIGDTTVRTVDRVGGSEGYELPQTGVDKVTNRVTLEFEFGFEA